MVWGTGLQALERTVFRSLFSLHRHLRLSSKQGPFWAHCWHFPALWCLCLSNQGRTQASPSSKKPLRNEGYCAPPRPLCWYFTCLFQKQLPFLSFLKHARAYSVWGPQWNTLLSTSSYVYCALFPMHPTYSKVTFAKIRWHQMTVQGTSALDKRSVKPQQAWAPSVKHFWSSWGHLLKTKGNWSIYFWDLIFKDKTEPNTSLESVSNNPNPSEK